VVFAAAVITGVLVVVSVFVRRRGASAELRKQLAWLGYVGPFVVVPIVALLPHGFATNGNANPVVGALFWTFLLVIPTVGIPLACAVAVLKYRLLRGISGHALVLLRRCADNRDRPAGVARPGQPDDRPGAAIYQCLFSQSARIGVPAMSKSSR
jgi:hypothetical protein